MPVQTSYSRLIQPALPGLLVNLKPNSKESFVNANGTPIDFGLGVVRGSGDREAILPNAPGQEFLGVTIREGFREITTVGGTVTNYAIGEMMNVLTQIGEIWVFVETNVSAGDSVYCRFAINSPHIILGAFRNDSDTVSSVAHADLVPSAKFNSSASAGGLAKLLFPTV
jgi:hypothetical protein